MRLSPWKKFGGGRREIMVRRTLSGALDLGHHSLNLLRLILASLLLASRASDLGGHDEGSVLDGATLGTMAACAFFGFSGLPKYL